VGKRQRVELIVVRLTGLLALRAVPVGREGRSDKSFRRDETMDLTLFGSMGLSLADTTWC
jgi:hypothetical protein